jgi:hypothetical protein
VDSATPITTVDCFAECAIASNLPCYPLANQQLRQSCDEYHPASVPLVCWKGRVVDETERCGSSFRSLYSLLFDVFWVIC